MPPVPTLQWFHWTIIKFMLLSLAESLWGLLCLPYLLMRGRAGTERPQIVCIQSAFNLKAVASCKALEAFSASPWALGPHAQVS